MPISKEEWDRLVKKGQQELKSRTQVTESSPSSTPNQNVVNKLRAAHYASETAGIATPKQNRSTAEFLFGGAFAPSYLADYAYEDLQNRNAQKFNKQMTKAEALFADRTDMSYDEAKDDVEYQKELEKNKKKADVYAAQGGTDRDEYEAALNKESADAYGKRKAVKAFSYEYSNQTRDEMDVEQKNLQSQYDAETDEYKKFAIEQQMKKAKKYSDSLLSSKEILRKIDENQKIIDDYTKKYVAEGKKGVTQEEIDAYAKARDDLDYYKNLLNPAIVNEWDDDVYALEPDDMQAFSIVYQYEKQSESDSLLGVESFNDPYRQSLDEQYRTAYNYLKQKYTEAEIKEMSKKFTYVADRDTAYQTTSDIINDIAEKTGAERLPYVIGLGLGTALDAYNAPVKIIDGLVQSLTGQPINVYDSTYSIATINNAIQQGLVQQSAHQKAASMAVGVYCSLVQMGATMGAGIASGVEGLSLFLMGSSAASQTMKDMAEKGASNDKIIASSIATGVAEALFEKVSLEGWLHPETILASARVQASLGETVKALLVQMGCEVSEEICTDIANEVTDYIINGGNSNAAMSIEAYKNMGYSQKQAENMYLTDFGEQLAETALSSAIISALMSPSSVISTDVQIDRAIWTAQAVANTTYGNAEESIKNYVLSGQSSEDADNIIQYAMEQTIADYAPKYEEIKKTVSETFDEAMNAKYTVKGEERVRATNKYSEKDVDRIADFAAKRGVNVRFATFNKKGQLVDANGNVVFRNGANGFYTTENGQRTIYLNPRANPNMALSFLAGHEISHDMQGTKEYEKLKEMVMDFYDRNVLRKGEVVNELDAIRERAINTYYEEYKNMGMSDEQIATAIEEEIVADALGTMLQEGNLLRYVSNNIQSWQHGFQKLMQNLRDMFSDRSRADTIFGQYLKAYNERYSENVLGERFSKDSSKHWVKDEGILNNMEFAYFYDMLSDIEQYDEEHSGKKRFNRSSSGDIIVPVKANSEGADTALVYFDGNYEDPTITKVIKIHSTLGDNVAEIEEVIYRAERINTDATEEALEWFVQNEQVTVYRAEDYSNARKNKGRYSRNSGTNSREQQNRTRSDTEVQRSGTDTSNFSGRGGGERFSIGESSISEDDLDNALLQDIEYEETLRKLADFAKKFGVNWNLSEDGTQILDNKNKTISDSQLNNALNLYNKEKNNVGETDYTRKDAKTVGLKDSTIENLVSANMFATGAENTTSDYSRGYLTWLSPEDFLKLTTDSQELYDRLKSESRSLDINEISEHENAREYDTIHLEVDKKGKILSHQGRHRMIAFREEGIERVPVVLWDTMDKQKPSVIDSMMLKGQNTSDPNLHSNYSVRIGEAIPINGKHLEQLKSEFGQSSSGMRFSIGENTVPTELDNQYMDAVNKGDMGTAQRIIDEESNDYLNSLLLPNDDDIEGFKFHKGSAPKHTMKRYAVFNVSEDGFKAAYAGNKVATPVGVWLDAVNLQSYVSDITQFNDGTFASYIIGDTGVNAKKKFSEQKLAEYGIKPSSRLLLERGGKHSSDVPNFSQMNLKQDENGNKVTSPKDGALPHNKLIFEIEYGYDEDLTDYVKEHGRISKGRNQGLAKIYPNQYYDFKTNPNAVGNWGIGGTFRITRLVPYSEVVEKTAEYKANAVQEAKDMYANGEISKADMNKRIAGADAITLQKWVGGYHPEEFGLTVEGVDEMYRNGQKMKLTDAITRDDNGKIILPSQRFNAEIADPRYSIGESTVESTDKQFSDAIASNDLYTAQLITDRLANEWAGNDGIRYSSVQTDISESEDRDTGEIITYVDGSPLSDADYANYANDGLIPLYRSNDVGYVFDHGNNGVFFTTSKHIANAFGSDIKGQKSVKMYGKAENPLVLDAKGNIYTNIPIGENAPEWLEEIASTAVEWDDAQNDYVETPPTVDVDNLVQAAFARGYDGVIVNNVREGVGGGTATDVILKSSKQARLADPVTYDDNGKPIKPSERFNDKNPDIRWSIGNSVSEGTGMFDELRRKYGEEEPVQQTPQSEQAEQTPQSIETDVDIKNEILADVGDLDDLIEHPVRVGGVPDPLIHNEPKLTKKETLQKKMQDFRGSVKKGAEFLATKFADSAYLIHDVSVKHNTNTYKWFTNGKSAPSMANNAIGGFTLKDGKPQFMGNMIDMTGKVVGKSVAEILYPYNHADSEFLEAHKVSEEEHMNECQEYLVMLLNRDEINMNGRPRINLSTNQDIRRLAKVGKMSYEDAKNQLVLQETQRRIDKFESEYGKDYANKLIEANHTICNYWLSLNVQSGQLTQKEAEAWLKAHPNYVPTIRHDGTDDSADFSAGKQGVFGEQRKKATGGGRQLIPLEYAYRQKINSAMKFGQRNVFFSYLLSDAEKYSELGDHMRVLATVKSAENKTQGEILGEYNGRANTYVAFTKDGGAVVFEVDGTLNTAIKDLTNPKLEVEQYLEAWQDVNTLWRGLVTTKNPLFTVSNAFRDAGQAMLMSESVGQYWKDYKRAYQEMKADSELYKQFMASGVMSSSISEGLREAQKDNFFSKLEGIGEMVEMLPRFSAYLTQIEKYGNTYEGRLNAQFAAKDITTNFSQGGDWTRMLNRNGFNFLNANVQGLLQIGRKITDPLKNQSLNRSQKLQALGGFAIRMTALGFAPYVVNAMMMALNPDRKRDYDELSDSIKTQYLLFPASDGVFIRIPYGRALVISTTLANLAQNAIEGKKINVGESLKTIWDNVGVAKPSGLWTPVVDAYNNKTWYGGTLVNYTLAQREKKDQYDESTDDFSKFLGRVFNVSPKKVNYVLDQWSGFIGDFAMPIVTDKYKSDNPLDYLAAPFKSRFTTDPTTNNDLYDTYNDMFTEVKKKAATDGSYYGAEQYFYSQSKEINSIWTQIHEVQRYKSLSQEEKDALQQKYMSYGSLDTYKVRQQIIRDMRKAINGIQRNTIENYDYIIDASSKYPITDDMTFSQKKTQTFKMNNDLFGSEYALQTYGGDTWDNAQLSNTCGIDFESYAEYFANTVDLRADKDENGNTISGTLKKKKWEALSSMNLSEGQRAFLFAMEYKISQKTNYYDSKALQKALNDYINTLPLSTEEKKYLKDNLK